MYIQTNDNNDIIQLVKIGDKPQPDGYEIDADTDIKILQHIFDYKYIDGDFVLKENAGQERLKNLQNIKIQTMRDVCRQQIINGFDHTDGHHYSFEETDQLNLQNLSIMAAQGLTTSYKYDGGTYQFYTPEEMLKLTEHAANYIMFHRTYYNQLKDQVCQMTSTDDVLKVNYGMELDKVHSEELHKHINKFNIQNFDVIEDINDYTYVLQDVDTSDIQIM